MLILAGVIIVSITGNNPIEQAKMAVVKTDISSIQSQVSLLQSDLVTEDYEFVTVQGKISEIDIDIEDKIIKKYDDILYVEDGNVCLNAVALMEGSYLNTKYKFEVKSLDNLDVTFLPIKNEMNEIKNGEFNEDKNHWDITAPAGNTATIKTERQQSGVDNKYMNLTCTKKSECKVSMNQITLPADNYNDVYYFTCKYRRQPSESLVVPIGPIRLHRSGGGHITYVLTIDEYKNSEENKWLVASELRKVLPMHESLNIGFEVGGGVAYYSENEMSIDIDDIIGINLNRIFPVDKIPTEAYLNSFFADKYYK